jgi:hypothetical protein
MPLSETRFGDKAATQRQIRPKVNIARRFGYFQVCFVRSKAFLGGEVLESEKTRVLEELARAYASSVRRRAGNQLPSKRDGGFKKQGP